MPFTEKFIIKGNLIPAPSKRRSGLMINDVRFLVAHDTGNKNSTAAQNVHYYINSRNEQSASAHLFVDAKEIIECVPALTAPPEKAWHVLYNVPKDNELYGVNANDAAIGVEYCFGDNIDADKAYEKYVWVLAKLCNVFELDPSKDIVGHFFLDPKRKTDPVTGLAYSRRTYDKLLKDVVTEHNLCIGALPPMPALNITTEQGTAITTVKLNVRNNPNTKADIIQVVAPRTTMNYKGVVQNGERVNNNPVWYQDMNNNYFWSGGVIPKVLTSMDSITVQNIAASSTNGEIVPDRACVDFIKKWEGLELKAYTDSAGIWTIGYGTIIYKDHSPVKQDDTITKEQAEELLAEEVKEKAESVNLVLKPVKLNQHQYNALVSFAYNAGIGALKNSTLLRRIKANPEDFAIRDAFMMWNKAHVDGKLVVVKGLDNRRREEAALYFS